MPAPAPRERLPLNHSEITALKQLKLLILVLGLATACAAPVPEGAGRLSADPAVPDVSLGPGTTIIQWALPEGRAGQLYVSVDGGAEKLVAEGFGGETTVTWIAAGRHYAFRLYEGRLRLRRLAELVIEVPVPDGTRAPTVHSRAGGHWPSAALRYGLAAGLLAVTAAVFALHRRGQAGLARRAAAAGAIGLTAVVMAAVGAVPPRALVTDQPYPDAAEYAEAAWHIAGGEGYVTRYAFGTATRLPQPLPALHPPGYSLALAPFALWAHADFPANVQLGAKVYTLLYVLAGVGLAWRLGGPLAAAIMATGMGVSPYAYSSAALVMSDSLGASLLILAVWLSLGATRWRAAGTGLVAGLMVVVRLNMLLDLMVLVVTQPARWRRQAALFALPGLLLIGGYQWAVFGSPLRMGQAQYVPELPYVALDHAYTRFFGHDSALDWGDNLGGAFEAWFCGCSERWPFTQVPNLVFYPALLLGLIWTFGPPLATLPGWLYAARHPRDPAVRAIVPIVLVALAFFAVSVIQARRYMAGPATLLLALSALAAARWLEAAWTLQGRGLGARLRLTRRAVGPLALGAAALLLLAVGVRPTSLWGAATPTGLPAYAAGQQTQTPTAPPPTPTAPATLSLPPGFVDELIAKAARPTDLAFTPDGRLLVTQQTGQLLVITNYAGGTGAAASALALDLAGQVCANWERGLGGVAVDPDFERSQAIYLYYTYNKHGACPLDELDNPLNPVNRLARFSLPAGNAVLTATESVVVDNIPQLKGTHNGGDLNFGADGWLYVSTGDGGRWANAADLSLLAGKILRIGTDGTVPADNPYAGAAGARRCGNPAGLPAGSGPCAEIFASGLRNPFRFAFAPGTNDFYINDVGQVTWEEVNRGRKGADYGWNQREGPCPFPAKLACEVGTASGFEDPVYAYHHDTGCFVITGSAFVPEGVWPAAYDRAYLFGDYGCGQIWQLAPGSPATAETFASGLGAGSLVSMAFGPYEGTQALYYVTHAAGGQVRRIRYAAGGN